MKHLIGATLLIGGTALAGPYNGQAQQNQQQQNSADNDEDTTVESFEYSQGQSHLGIAVMGLNNELRQFFGAPMDRGVLVAHVEANSPAMRAGLHVGDVVIDVANRRVQSPDDVLAALAEQNSGRIRLDVVRSGQRLALTARLPINNEQNLQPEQRDMNDTEL
ncbi:MAG TPA: PDZ domain-containing protein [Kofleriaceae bacterium]|nr:PDZ domain-containing protein [Kofleriaceae bacterium]